MNKMPFHGTAVHGLAINELLINYQIVWFWEQSKKAVAPPTQTVADTLDLLLPTVVGSFVKKFYRVLQP